MLTTRVIRLGLAALFVAGALSIASAPSALAADNCYLDPNNAAKIICEASTPESPGGASPATTAAAEPTFNDGSGSVPKGGAAGVAATQAASSTQAVASGECAWRVLDPPPPAGDPRWAGHDPSTGVVLYNNCNGPVQYTFAASAAAAPALPPPPPPPPDPAVLARQALTELTLPKPTLGRSPDLSKGDPAKNNSPYTVVNLWTRYYSDPAAWGPVSRTVTLRGVFATVTATPTALNFDPGDGNAPVSCPGPGRAWQDSDGFDPPAAGECGYQYKKIEATPITGTETITWNVSWTGTGGSGGTFPVQATSVSSQFIVEQIEIVTGKK